MSDKTGSFLREVSPVFRYNDKETKGHLVNALAGGKPERIEKQKNNKEKKKKGEKRKNR